MSMMGAIFSAQSAASLACGGYEKRASPDVGESNTTRTHGAARASALLPFLGAKNSTVTIGTCRARVACLLPASDCEPASVLGALGPDGATGACAGAAVASCMYRHRFAISAISASRALSVVAAARNGSGPFESLFSTPVVTGCATQGNEKTDRYTIRCRSEENRVSGRQ